MPHLPSRERCACPDEPPQTNYARRNGASTHSVASKTAPITAFHDGEIYWLADGFHRVAAAKKTELTEVEVEVRQGGQRDAIVYSVGARQVAVAARASTPEETLTKVRQRMERHRQWITDFLDALDQAANGSA